MSKERMPGAEWRPLPEAGAPDGYTKTQLIYHSIVGSAEGAYNYFLTGTSLESTFIVKKNGHIIQCMNGTDKADANSTANRRAISVETEDNGNPNIDPWTPQQLDALVKIAVWAHKEHGIPARLCPAHDQPGIGYHTLFGAPSPWTPVSKTCPGTIRIKQFNEVLLPRIIAAVNNTPNTPLEEDDLPMPFVARWEGSSKHFLVMPALGQVKHITHPNALAEFNKRYGKTELVPREFLETLGAYF